MKGINLVSTCILGFIHELAKFLFITKFAKVPAAPDRKRKMKVIFHTTLTTNSSASTGSIFANFLVAGIPDHLMI